MKLKALLILAALLLLPLNVTRGGECVYSRNGESFIVTFEDTTDYVKLPYHIPCHYEYYDSVTSMFWVDTVFDGYYDIVYEDTAHPNWGALKWFVDTVLTKHPVFIPCSTLACEEEIDAMTDTILLPDLRGLNPILINDNPTPKCDTVMTEREYSKNTLIKNGYDCEYLWEVVKDPNSVHGNDYVLWYYRCVRCGE